MRFTSHRLLATAAVALVSAMDHQPAEAQPDAYCAAQEKVDGWVINAGSKSWHAENFTQMRLAEGVEGVAFISRPLQPDYMGGATFGEAAPSDSSHVRLTIGSDGNVSVWTDTLSANIGGEIKDVLTAYNAQNANLFLVATNADGQIEPAVPFGSVTSSEHSYYRAVVPGAASKPLLDALQAAGDVVFHIVAPNGSDVAVSSWPVAGYGTVGTKGTALFAEMTARAAAGKCK